MRVGKNRGKGAPLESARHGRRQSLAQMRWKRGDGGAALVEFAFVMVPLFLVVFGVIEFGWAFYQKLDVRHGAREGARLAAVNYIETSGATGATQLAEIIGETCDRMDSSKSVSVEITRTDGPDDNATDLTPLIIDDDIGDSVTVHIQARLDTLTGFLDFAFPADPKLDSTVTVRLEQAATYDETSGLVPCP